MLPLLLRRASQRTDALFSGACEYSSYRAQLSFLSPCFQRYLLIPPDYESIVIFSSAVVTEVGGELTPFLSTWIRDPHSIFYFFDGKCFFFFGRPDTFFSKGPPEIPLPPR